jgi:Velvet factor
MLNDNLNLSDDGISLSIAQNPQISRMCGILESNTLRLIDPPLVLALDVETEYNNQQLQDIGKRFVCVLNLFESKSRQNADYIFDAVDDKSELSSSRDNNPSPARMHNLVGNTVSSAILLKTSHEYDSKRKLFFVFPTLSVRLPGTYYLSCIVSRIG